MKKIGTIINHSKANLSFFLMKKPLPYTIWGKSRRLIKKAKVEFNKLLYKTHQFKLNNKNVVVYEFNSSAQKKAVVVHGWMSESLHMMMHIKFLCEQGYKVYAIDLPAHGKSKGQIVTWKDAINTILRTQQIFGPFDLALGHSFGGGMIMNATGVSYLSDEFSDVFKAKKYILLASALSINVPIRIFSKLGRLNNKEKEMFKDLIVQDARINFEEMNALNIQTKYPQDASFLLIHGKKDFVVKIEESKNFNQLGNNVKLIEKDDMNHIDILYNDEILKDIAEFI